MSFLLFARMASNLPLDEVKESAGAAHLENMNKTVAGSAGCHWHS